MHEGSRFGSTRPPASTFVEKSDGALSCAPRASQLCGCRRRWYRTACAVGELVVQGASESRRAIIAVSNVRQRPAAHGALGSMTISGPDIGWSVQRV